MFKAAHCSFRRLLQLRYGAVNATIRYTFTVSNCSN